MNQLKHFMGIPITLPNGLALRGSTFSRSAGGNGRNPTRSGKLLIATGDDDDITELKLTSNSYARIIDNYSKEIDTRNAAAKLNREAKTNNNTGFFSKLPFQRLARVYSMMNIENGGKNKECNLSTETSKPTPSSIQISNKSRRSISCTNDPGILNEVNNQAEWLDHVVKAHNVKKIQKNINFSNDRNYGKNKTHYLVQSLPESRATRSATRSSFNDNCSSPVKKFPATAASDVNNIFKMSKTGKKMLKSISDTSVHHSLSVKKVTDNSATVVNKMPTRTKAENTIPKCPSHTSVHKNLPVKKLQDSSTSDVRNMPQKSTSGITITKSISNTSVYHNSSGIKLLNDSKNNVNNISKRIKPRNIIVESKSNTSVHQNSSGINQPNNLKNNVNNISTRIKTRNINVESMSNTNVHKKMPNKKFPDNSTHDVNNMSKKNKLDNTITKSISDTSVGTKTSAGNFFENSARDINKICKRSKTQNAILKSMIDKSVHLSLPVRKLPDNSTKNANITFNKSSTTGKTNSNSCSNPVDRYCSLVERMSRTSGRNSQTASNLKSAPIMVQRSKKTGQTLAPNLSGDTNVGPSKFNKTKNVNQPRFNNLVDRSYSSVEKQSETSTNDMKNISVIVQRLSKTDKTRELSNQNSQDDNMMLVTVSENCKSPPISKSSPLRHIDLRINGKPAAEVDSIIRKVDKLGVVSSAEKIEITIPVFSKNKEALDDNLRAPNSTINLCISSQAQNSTGLNEIGYMCRTEKRIDSGSVRSKSCLTRQSRIKSTMKNTRRPGSSTYRSKVIPWWTSADSFRSSEIVSTRPNKPATNNINVGVNMSRVQQSLARVNQEVHDRKPIKIAFSDARKTPNIVVAKPSSARRPLYRKKRTSVISKIVANEVQKKIEQDEQERLLCKQLTPERMESYVKPDMKVKSTASNVPKKEGVAIDPTMPGKTAEAKMTTSNPISEKNTSLPKTVVTTSGAKTITVEIEPSTKLVTSSNNNVPNANNFQERLRAKPISAIIKGKLSANKNLRRSPRQNLEDKAVSKVAAKLRQEVLAKSDTNAAPQLPRTYGKIRLLPPSQSLAKTAERENNSHSPELVRPSGKTSIDDKLSKVKNVAITMKPIEKKKDGTLIDYGITVNTHKNPERKLSGLESTNGLQGKKLTKQKETAVVATVKEVIPRRNRITSSSTINPHGIEDSSGSRAYGLHKNVRPISKTGISISESENIASKPTTNELKKFVKLGASVKTEKKDCQNSNKSPVIETASAADKKLVYSVWLRRFKERTGEDSDPTKDPFSRKP